MPAPLLTVRQLLLKLNEVSDAELDLPVGIDVDGTFFPFSTWGLPWGCSVDRVGGAVCISYDDDSAYEITGYPEDEG